MGNEISVLINKIANSFTIPANPGAIYASLTLVGTATVFFFTIILIPFQQYASQYTPSLFRYIRRDRQLRVGFFGLLSILAIEAFLAFISPTKGVVILSLVGVMFSFLLLGFLLTRVTKLLNPQESSLISIQKKAKIDLIRLFKKLKKREKSPEEKIRELEEMMRQTLNTFEKADPKNEFFQIPKEFLHQVRREIKILKEMAIRFIQREQNEMFESAMNAIGDVVKYYLKLRKDYMSNTDDFLIDTSEDFNDLLKLCEKSANIYYLRILWREVADVSIASLDVKVIGTKEGYHYLPFCFTELIRKAMLKHIIMKKTDSAYEAARFLGEIGLNMTIRGYIKTGAQICKYLSDNIYIALRIGETAFPYIAKQYMAEIFYQSLNNRILFTNYDHPYHQMLESYEKVLSISGQTIAIGLSDPIIWYEADMLKDFSISSLVRVALFPQNDSDDIISKNISVIRRLIGLMKRNYLKDYFFQSSFTNQLYQSALWLIAFIDKEVSLELLVYYNSVNIPIAENIRKATELIFDIIDFAFDKYIQSIVDQNLKIMERTELLNIVLSIYYLLIYFDAKHDLKLTDQLKGSLFEKIRIIKGKIKSLSLDDVEWANLELFLRYLTKISFDKVLQRKLNVILKISGFRSVSKYEPDLLDYIERPLVTFKSDFFNSIDKDIFG